MKMLPLNGQNTASKTDYLLLREVVVKSAVEANKRGSEEFWNMALYWYIGDVIKSGINKCKATPYDDVSHKEMSRGGQRKDRIKKRRIRNIVELANAKAGPASPSRRAKAVLWSLIYGLAYLGHKALTYRAGVHKRNYLVSISISVEDPLAAYAIRQIPICYVEDLDFFYGKLIQDERPIDTRKLKGGYSIAYAARMDYGLPTRLEQHGAFYGELRDHKGTDIETRLPSQFYTWGWEYENNHIPARRPKRLENFRLDLGKKRWTDEWVLVALPTHLEKSHVITASRLCDKLSRVIEAYGLEVVIRPRPPKERSKRIQLEKFMEEQFFGEFTLDMSTDLTESIAKSRLVVCSTHPANLFMQCIYANQPVVALSDSRTKYHDLHQEWTEKICRLGLLHFEMESLVQNVANKIPVLSDWWSEVNLTSDMVGYKEKYCGMLE